MFWKLGKLQQSVSLFEKTTHLDVWESVLLSDTTLGATQCTQRLRKTQHIGSFGTTQLENVVVLASAQDTMLLMKTTKIVTLNCVVCRSCTNSVIR